MLDKQLLRDTLRRLQEPIPEWSSAETVLEQTTNRVLALEKPDRSLLEMALHVTCPYCGYTAGNLCRSGVSGPNPLPLQYPHPSRLRAAMNASIL